MNDAEEQIRKVLSDRDIALGAKNLEALMAYYSPSVVVFDAIPPFVYKGTEALRLAWEGCFPCFPDSFGTEIRNLCIAVGGDVASAHYLWRFSGMEPDHPAMQTWMRNTTLLERKQGEWLITHEHWSVPFDPNTSKVVFSLDGSG